MIFNPTFTLQPNLFKIESALLFRRAWQSGRCKDVTVKRGVLWYDAVFLVELFSLFLRRGCAYDKSIKHCPAT